MPNKPMQFISQQWMRGHKPDMVNFLIIGVVWSAMVTLANPIGDFPLNDDWVYARAVKSVLENGYYNFPSPSSANVGPQVYWGALFCLPFGFSFTALRFSSLTLGLIGVLTLYRLIKVLGCDPKIALLGALVLAVNPLYFGLANSFMTDVPFIALVMGALYFLVRGLQRDSRIDITVGLVISFAAILVRQLGLVVLLAFAFAYPIKYGFRVVNIAKVFALIVVGALLHITYQYWLVHTARTPLLSGHSDVQNMMPSLNWAWNMRQAAIKILSYVGFFVLPFSILFIQHKPSGFESDRLKNTRLILVAFAALFFGVLWWTGNMMPSLQNILIKSGVGPLTLRDTYNFSLNNPIIPKTAAVFWVGVTVLSAAAAAAVIYYVGLAVRQAFVEVGKAESRSRNWAFWLFFIMAATYFMILVFIAGRFPMFDRYLLLLFPLVILLVSNVKFDRLSPVRSSGVVMSVALIALYAGFSVAATHDYLSWNRTRWDALHSLIDDSKVRPNQIDGGYEFNGWFLYDAKYKMKPDKSWWWVDDDEYVITSGPLPGYTEVRRYTFNRWLLLSESNILVLRRSSNSD